MKILCPTYDETLGTNDIREAITGAKAGRLSPEEMGRFCPIGNLPIGQKKNALPAPQW